MGQIQSHAAEAISVAVVLDDRIAGSHTFGNANARTAFSIGSVSKIFTAVSVLQLVEAGRVALGGDVATYLPAYTGLRGITVRQLLTHTSGLPNYADDAIATGAVAGKTTPAEIIASMLAKPRDFPPGGDWNYSNTGYVVLGQLVESVSGEPLAHYEQRHIFDVADMRDTFVAGAQRKDAARPFDGDPGDWSWYYACGDAFSTAGDLARFDIALMRGTLLRPSTFALMRQTVPFATLAPGVADGLGVFVSLVGNVSLVGHHGGEPGYRADNEMVPDRGFAVAVVGNGNYNTAPIVAQALQSYLGVDLKIPLPPAAYVDGAPEFTARLRSLLADVSAGRDDRTQLQVLAVVALPDLAAQLKADGSLTGLKFMSKFYTFSGVLYRYELLFGDRRALLTALLDKSDKIAQLQMVTLPPINSASGAGRSASRRGS